MNGNERRNDCLKDGCSDDECEYVNNMTVFEKITASPEVLAPEFVGMMYNRVCGDYLNYSMLTGEWYATHAEAIAATVARLKEGCDD